MILVDTSIWIDRLRRSDNALLELLDARQVLAHPFVIGELAAGSIKNQEAFLDLLGDLPQALLAEDREVLRYIKSFDLHGMGVGYLDFHLFVSCRLTAGASLWSRDRRLHELADRFHCAATPSSGATH